MSASAASISAAQCLHELSVDAEQGLSTSEAESRLARYGPNELAEPPPEPLWKLVLAQFDDLLVKMLLAAAVVSFCLALGEEAGSARNHAMVEPLVILTILVLNAGVGVWQESNAEKAIEALKQYEPNDAEVRRDGCAFRVVRSVELVPGDIVRVVVGCRVPADLRLIALQSTTLRADQAILTGESEPALKETELLVEAGAEIQAKGNMAFSGTTISYGSALGVVVATGDKTEMGIIGEQVASTQTAASPLKVKLDEFGEMLSKVIAAICVLLWLINIGHFTDPAHGSWAKGAIYYFKIAIALAVAAIPEGLPAVVTTCLALGTRRMAARNAIVRYLPSVETLGTTGIICSDKTGTLTTGKMAATHLLTLSANGTPTVLTSAATGYDPTSAPLSTPAGTIADATSHGDACEPLRSLSAVCALCNGSHISYSHEKGMWVHTGEPTEAALRALAEKLRAPDVPPSSTEAPERTSEFWRRAYQPVATLEFSRTRKSMGVLASRTSSPGVLGGGGGGSGAAHSSHASAAASSAGGGSIGGSLGGGAGGGAGCGLVGGGSAEACSLFVKGAPESVIERCDHVMLEGGAVVPLTPPYRSALAEAIAELAGGAAALRCLACALRHGMPAAPSALPLSQPERFGEIEAGLTLVGIVGLRDPPRPEVADAIETCGMAGIRVMVITGDNLTTGEAVCRSIGLHVDSSSSFSSAPSAALGHGHGGAPSCAIELEGGGQPQLKLSYTGREFAELSAEGQRVAVATACLFARTEPAHKLRLVQLLQEAGHVVAMTGDGVNDAPALKKANIGVAMGSGTAVAKSAADMVLADDNFSTIVAAVEEGRAIFNNTKAFIRYLISSNIGEVACIFLTAALGMPEALVPVQLLWVNLVTDGLPATALSFNPPDAEVMLQPPRSLSESFVDNWLFIRYMLVGLYVGVATVGGFAYWFMGGYAANGGKFAGSVVELSWHQLTHFHRCKEWADPSSPAYSPEPIDCAIFTDLRPRTVALSVLVTIEMLNALNALSENQSLLRFPPSRNLWLVGAIGLSFAQHFTILYVTWFNSVFGVEPLDASEWWLVLVVSVPVILLDEVLKLITRTRTGRGRSYAAVVPGGYTAVPQDEAKAE